MTEPIRNHADALERLDDQAYFAWCMEESRKVFQALICKRFPTLVKPRAPHQGR